VHGEECGDPGRYFGVLKAGGAYVPLDPRNPEDRLRYMVEDARCRVVVTETGGVGQKLGAGAREIVRMDGRRGKR